MPANPNWTQLTIGNGLTDSFRVDAEAAGNFFTLELSDTTGGALSSTSLPARLNLGDWNAHRSFRWEGHQCLSYVGGAWQWCSVSAFGDIVAIAAIPEPGAFLLLGLGAAGLLFARRG